jgi:hypothetical protein
MKKFKDIVKKNPEPARGTNYVNPSQLGQYSATNQVSEGALEDYLSARGIESKFLSKDSKIAHAKSNAFLKWKKDRMASHVQGVKSVREDLAKDKGDGEPRSSDSQSPTLQRKKRLDKANKHYLIQPSFTHPPKNPIKIKEELTENKHYVVVHNRKTNTVEMVKNGDDLKFYPTKSHAENQAKVLNSQQTPEVHYRYGGILKEEKDSRLSKSVFKDKHIKGSQTPALTPESVGEKQDTTVKAWNNRYLLKQLLKYLGITEEKKPKMSALDKFRRAAAQRDMKHKETEKNSGGMTAAIDRLQKHMNKEEVNEANITHAAHFDDPKTGKWASMALLTAKNDQDAVMQAHDLLRTDAYRNFKLSAVEKHEPIKNIKMKEDMDPNSPKEPAVAKELKGIRKRQNKDKIWEGGDLMGDPKAAEISPADGANGGKEISEKKRQMSKSARLIKALYKKHKMVKEDMFDHEKEDKSVKTYGKKPKFEKAEKEDKEGEKKSQAAAVLTGGTTLTGEKRDDVEIDPMMRNRPGQPDVTKKDDKKDDKKEDKKKDK